MNRSRRILLVATLAVTGAMAVSIMPFLRSQTSHPARADAVIVLSGDHGERLVKALELMGRGVAPTLVLAGEPDFAQVDDLCRAGTPFEVVCLRPEPDSTRAEARATGRLATSRGWRTLVVVTTSYHTTRSGILFRRCVDGAVTTVAANPPYGRRKGARQVVHEWLGVAQALTVRRGC